MLALLLAGILPATATAQLPESSFDRSGAGDRSRVPTPTVQSERRHAITGNLILGLAGFYNVEYERRLGARTTWGLAGTLSVSRAGGDYAYRTAKGLFRFYPKGTALRGPFLGFRVGVSRVSDSRYDTGRYFVLGAEVGHTALRGQHFVSSVGVGASRPIGMDREAWRHLSLTGWRTLPVVRLNIGVTF